MKRVQKEKLVIQQVKRRVVNISPQRIWGAREVQESPEVLCLLANMRRFDTTVASVHKPPKLANLLYHTARSCTQRYTDLFHVLDGTVEGTDVELLVHPYKKDNDLVIAIRMSSEDWHTLLRQAKPISIGVSA